MSLLRALRSRLGIGAPSDVAPALGRRPSRGEVEQFIAERESRFHGLLVSEGVIYRTTPFEVVSWVFAQWREQLGDLAGKRLLDFGCGDLRYGLLASNLLSMEVLAVEFDAVVYLDARASFRDAERCGYTEGLKLASRANVLHLPWGEFDIIHYFYTHPDTAGASTDKRDKFRRRLQEKMLEVGSGAVLSLLFTDAQVRAGHHVFPDLVPIMKHGPSFPAADDVCYSLQLYRRREVPEWRESDGAETPPPS